MGVMSGNPKEEPLHYGEIYSLWQFSTAAKGCISSHRLYQYHVGDKELRQFLGSVIDQAELEVSECDKILTQNGIPVTAKLPDRPEAKLEDIPIGARFTDQEVSVMAAADLAAGLVACSSIMGISIREDIGALFAKYHATKTALSLRILRMSKDRGWIIPPPLQVKRPELVEA